MTEEVKIRFLFKKVQHTGLKSAGKALKAQMTAGVNVTYTMATNHLSTAVSELPEYISKNRNMSAVGKDKLEDGSEKPTIYNSNKSIKTGYIQLCPNPPVPATLHFSTLIVISTHFLVTL